MVNEYLPHQARGHSVKMSAILPVRHFLFDHPHVGFVNECGWFQSMIAALTFEITSCETTQLLIHQWHQLIERAFVTLSPINQQPGYLIWPSTDHAQKTTRKVADPQDCGLQIADCGLKAQIRNPKSAIAIV